MNQKPIYLLDVDAIRDRRLVLEADGFGGAYAMLIEGNYPVDYVAHMEKHFQSEKEAINATSISEQRANPLLLFR